MIFPVVRGMVNFNKMLQFGFFYKATCNSLYEVRLFTLFIFVFLGFMELFRYNLALLKHQFLWSYWFYGILFGLVGGICRVHFHWVLKVFWSIISDQQMQRLKNVLSFRIWFIFGSGNVYYIYMVAKIGIPFCLRCVWVWVSMGW